VPHPGRHHFDSFSEHRTAPRETCSKFVVNRPNINTYRIICGQVHSMNFNFSQFIAPEYQGYLLPGAVALIGVLVCALLMVGKKKSKKSFKLKKAKISESQLQFASMSSLAERRGAIRREGAPVEVLVSSPTIKNGISNGYVLDRSTGGLRLAVAEAVAPGSILQVKAAHAPDTTPWVVILVRSCRPNQKHFELGVEFEKTPPWNVLLLFG
jgi:hypothetical protein